ncbi:MAG: cytochrome P450 [Burkholderiales bacterium]
MNPLSTDASSLATGPVTAASHAFDPFTQAYQRDPHSLFARLRETEPVFFSPALNTWVVLKHDTIKSVFRDTPRYSAAITSDPLVPLCPYARSIIQASAFDVPATLVNCDPPAHDRYRKFFQQPLERSRMMSFEPFIRETVNARIDDMLAAGPSNGNTADLVPALTWETPALVLFKMLGVPAEDVQQVKRWADSRAVLQWGRPTDAEQTRIAANTVEYFNYTAALVRRKLAEPGDDVITDFLRQRDGDDANMSLREITGTVFNLLFAGHETTSASTIGMFNLLLRERDLWGRIGRGEQPIGPVVEECLRLAPPIFAWRRMAKEDVVLDGITLPAGSRLLLMLGAANRDPAVFPQPDTFDPTRRNALQHMAFGTGLHFCAGAPLARLQMSVMLEEMSRRLPGLRLVDDQELVYLPNSIARVLTRLLVTW